MPRIMLVYPDGQTTYGQFNTDEQGPHFILGKVRYTIDDIAKSGAIAAVNSPEMLRTFPRSWGCLHARRRDKVRSPSASPPIPAKG